MRRGLTTAACSAWLLASGIAHTASVVDDAGHTVSLPRPAQRIVTLAPHATELVMAAGAADRLVAIASGQAVGEALRGLPRIGGPGGLDREALLALQPNLVIGWQSGNRATDLDWIERSGIAVYRSEPRALQDIAASIRAIGLLSGTPHSAARAATAFERALLTRCARQPLRAAYVLVWQHPPITIGGRHWLNDALRAAGFRNLFAAVDRGTFQIAPEALLAAGPATRITLLPGAADRDQRTLADLLSRPGPRLPEAVDLLCMRRLQLDAGP